MKKIILIFILHSIILSTHAQTGNLITGDNAAPDLEGDENTIMGLPVDKIKQYIESLS